MVITCWGSRGSIPVSGRSVVNYGGDTTCMTIQTACGEIIIVDAGTGIRRLGNHLLDLQRHRYHLLLTHAHWDHLMGFPFFKPLYLSRTVIHMQPATFGGTYMSGTLSRVMGPPNFPVRFADLKTTLVWEKGHPGDFQIGSVTVRPVAISHPNGGIGYKFVEDGKTFVFITDNELGYVHPGGLPFTEYVDFCAGADLLIHDGEYTAAEYRHTRKWGHSAYTDTLNLAFEAGVAKLGLFHLNQERTDAQMDAIVDDCRRVIADSGRTLECFAVGQDMRFTL